MTMLIVSILYVGAAPHRRAKFPADVLSLHLGFLMDCSPIPSDLLQHSGGIQAVKKGTYILTYIRGSLGVSGGTAGRAWPRMARWNSPHASPNGDDETVPT
ncbi:hypothetical protein OH76DRAFT_1409001 [Lentinus brumalis]|uniref:Uncharacterized protein n=1 Tax=Lentinus brumalis TaxID=2498619 RepID=A0A371CWF9_9APHY|nr:hypothetical protein OH76DRAFT_1409001 [Polyporus brumalis]